MTSGYKVSLWRPGGPGPIPHPSVLPEGWRKGPTGVEKEGAKVRKIGKREPKEGGIEWESERWRGGREGWAKTSEREREREWAGGFAGFGGIGWLKLVRSQSWALGMKTGRAVCRSQARGSTLPEKSSFSPPPNLHSHLLPSRCIHHPIHHPLCSTAWPPLLDSATLSNRPDGLNEIHPAVCSRLNHRNATALQSYFTSEHSFAKASTTKPAQCHFEEAQYEAMCRSLHTKEKKNLMPLQID